MSVGASLTLEAARRGVRVVAAARRKELLEELAHLAEGEVHPLVCDVMEPVDCQRVVDEAALQLGGLDWVVYTPAVFILRELEEVTAAEWQRVFGLNVIGAALVTTAALPYLSESHGRVVYFTSVTTTVDPHWPGLASYATSKTALMKLAQCWRYERPEIGFTVVQLGQTEGSDGPNLGEWTPEQRERFYMKWRVPGRLTESPTYQDRVVVADTVLHSLSSPSFVEQITVVPPRD